MSMKVTTRLFAVLALAVGPASAVVAQDAEAGAKVFKKCAACHAVGEGADHKVGPALNGIVGAPAGAVAGFRYSTAMVAAGEAGLIWDDATLAAFLTKPKDVVAKTKMSFPGLKKDEDLLNVIAYLKSFPDR